MLLSLYDVTTWDALDDMMLCDQYVQGDCLELWIYRIDLLRSTLSTQQCLTRCHMLYTSLYACQLYVECA